MVKLPIWNNDYICMQKCRECGGIPPLRKVLKIRPSKYEPESVFSSFSVENNGISVYIIKFLLFH